jgi:UrcA family protein
MSLKVLSRLLGAGAACATAAFGISVAPAVHAQPAYDNGYYADDYAPSVGEITVRPSRRYERSEIGAPIVWARARRIVDASDLDLSTGWGRRALYHRVSNAAWDACNDLDNSWTMGLYPVDDPNGVDCHYRAVHRAMHRALGY